MEEGGKNTGRSVGRPIRERRLLAHSLPLTRGQRNSRNRSRPLVGVGAHTPPGQLLVDAGSANEAAAGWTAGRYAGTLADGAQDD